MMITNQRRPSTAPLQGFVALVVDNDLESRRAVRVLLETMGGRITEAESAAAALSAFGKCWPDIVLLAVPLPGMGSLNLCSQIQALSNGIQTPVLMMTLDDDEETINLALGHGCADYVTKPIRPALLHQRVRRLLQVHRVDSAIVQAKKEWESALDAVSDLIILTDLNDKIIRCNLATIQHLQTTYAQLIGCDLEAVLSGDHSQKLSLSNQQSCEMQFPSLPGWFEVSSFPSYMQGHQHAMVYVLKDITERKQLEEDLYRSEQRFKALVENIAEGIALFDPEGRICYASPVAARILGYPPDTEFVGINPMDSLHPDDLERNLVLFAQLLQQPGGSFTTELRVQHTNGSWIWVESSARNMLEEPGINAILVNFKDITERKRAEVALRASEARYRTLFEDSPVALWEEDFSEVKTFFDRLRTEEGVMDFRAYLEAHPEAVVECAARVRVKDVNKAALKLLNAQQKEQLLGELGSIVSPETNASFRKHLIAIAEGSLHYAFEGPNQALDGEIRQVSGLWSVWPGYEHSLSNVIVSVVDLTERKQAEAALAESEQRFRQFFAASPDAVLVIDPSHPVTWTVVDCNEAACRMNGYTRDELIGQSIDLLNSTAGTAQERAVYLERLRCEGVVQLETFHRHKDGYIFPVEISTTLFSLEGRQLILGIDRDITERKQAEEALRLSEERFELVMHATNDAIWDLNLSTGERWWNAGVRALFGYKSDQIDTAQAWWEAQIHPDDRLKVLSSFQTALASDRQFWAKEYRCRRADGTYANVFDRGYIIQDRHGVPVRVIGAMMDITERKRMEEALIKSEELFSKAFHASPAPMAITGADHGILIDVNHSWERLLGYSRQEVIGHRILDLHVYSNPQDRTRIMDLIREQGKLENLEIKITTESGEEREILISAQAVEIQDQACLLSTLYDITELRRMHGAMLASQKLADLGTLAAGVAHEMNSPLQVITGVSQSLLRKTENSTVEPEQLKRNLDVIHRNGWRCAEIVRSLHTYARNSGGPMQPASLNELVSDGLLLIEHQLKSWANISVRTSLAEDLPALTCDRNQITQVLINLLTNARDAMPDGGEISIATGHDPQADQLILQISDTGTGIPDSIRSKIFDPFFTTKPLGRGTGLGLSIVDGIVRAHGGNVDVSDVLPRGTMFNVRFPVRPVILQSPDVGDALGRFDDVLIPGTHAAGQTTI